ncbi:MAG TPA: UbiD family decarboxylase [Verrucomicrobiae bacterium]|nr:UbiD family decarboxylase [Verrucomicrobiae bacterium]
MRVDSPLKDLRAFLDLLRRDRDLAEVKAEVDPRLEIAEIHRRVVAAGGPALLFTNVRGHRMPVVTNLFGTARRVERSFGRRPEQLIARAASLPQVLMPPTPAKLWRQRDLLPVIMNLGTRTVTASPVLEQVEHLPHLNQLPALTTWPRDGGPFITLGQVYTEHPDGHGHNLGLYRLQIYDDTTTGMHWQIGKGGGFHHAAAETLGRALPVAVSLGGPPALMLSAVAPLPENTPELLLASLVMGRKLPMARMDSFPLSFPADAEIVLLGQVPPGERRPEGPFGDHYGYYSLTHDYPVFRVDAVARRRDAIYPATVVGKPRQEDFYIGDYLQALLSPLFPVVMPAVTDLWSYGETGYHSLSAAVVRQRYKREAMASAFRILGEGQLSLTKFLLALDRPCDLKDFRRVLTEVLRRADFRTDLFVFANLAMDSLDYAGPRVNEGSKAVLLGVGEPVRELPGEFQGALPAGIREARVFAPGCLVLTATPFPSELPPGTPATDVTPWLEHPSLAPWPLVVLTDDAQRATRSVFNFLWMTFTRFEPAADLHARRVYLARHHPVFESPIAIDARMKPWYPEELFADRETVDIVRNRWKEYFPRDQVPMGDSDRAHLD